MKTTKEAAAQYCCVKIGGLTITYSQKRAHYPHRSQNIAFFQLTVVDGPAHCLSLGSEKYLYTQYTSLCRDVKKKMAQSASVPPLGEPRALRARAGANRLLLLIQMDIQMGIAHFNLIFREHSLDSLVHLEINVPVVLGFCPEAKNIANGAVIIRG